MVDDRADRVAYKRGRLSLRNGWLRIAIQQAAQLVEDAHHVFLVVLVDVFEALDDAADTAALEFEEGLFAVGGEADVDLAFIAWIDAALNEGAVAVFQGADDARHLRGQHAQEALNVADDHRVVRLEQRKGEEFDFPEIAAAAPAAERGKTNLRDDLEQFVGHVLDTVTSADGHGKASLRQERSWVGAGSNREIALVAAESGHGVCNS